MDKIMQKAKVVKTQYTPEGTLYEGTLVRVENTSDGISRVKDPIGKIYYIPSKHLLNL